jgi:signal transduction histidine kinase
MARAIRGGQTSLNEEIAIECFDGARKIILHSAVPIWDEHQVIVGAIAVNQDITDRKRAEDALRLLPSRLIAAQEEERKRLAHELHDGIGGSLGAIKFALQNTLKLMEEGGAEPGCIRDLIEMTDRTIEEARRIFRLISISEGSIVMQLCPTAFQILIRSWICRMNLIPKTNS